jgi:hypothetical protein
MGGWVDTRDKCRIGWIGVRGCVGGKGGFLTSSLCINDVGQDK